MEYIETIKQVMNERNLSQEKLANILNVNQTAVSKWLRGERKPSYDIIRLFYEKLGVEPNELFGIK